MNTTELITKLKERFYEVNDADLHEGKTEAGITVWGIGVFDLVGDTLSKKNLTFYTKDNNAFWGNSEPNPSIPVREPTFTDRVNTYLASQISNGSIKFGHIDQVSELTQKALITAVIGVEDKQVIISENPAGKFSIQVL